MLTSKTDLDRAAVLERTLAALAGNRAPGFHFPGYFLQLAWPRIDEQSVVQTMESGTHCRGADGNVHPTALGVMIDGALSSAARLAIEPGARLATVHVNVQFTGRAARGALEMAARFEGFFTGDAARQALTRGALTSTGELLAHASGTFVLLPAPAGVTLAPLPWQRKGAAAPAPLELRELQSNERIVMRAARAALDRAGAQESFIERFWGVLPKPAADGARCRVKIEPQIGNRVGHVQGGILLGLAQATASAAVPGHRAVSNISAWYVSPGHGKTLTARSRVLHAGRSFAIVRTEIKNADGTRVLEAVSNHAA